MHWVRDRLPKRNNLMRFMLAFYLGQALLGSAIGIASGIYMSAKYPPEVIARAIMEGWGD